MSAFERKMNCQDIAPLLVFYACDEVSDKERKQIEAHLSLCGACAAQIAEEREFQEIVVTGRQPADELDSAGVLLSQCRSELAEQLDDLSAPPVREHWHPFGWLVALEVGSSAARPQLTRGNLIQLFRSHSRVHGTL